MAEQNVDFNFNFGKHKDWAPYTGDGGSDLFPFDGFIAVQLVNMRPYFTEKNKYPALKVSGVCQDEEAKGARVISDVLCGGTDKNGEDLGRQFLTLLHSSGTPEESIKQNAANNVEGSIKAISSQLVNRVAYAEIERDMYDGKETTKVKNWIAKERYEQAKAIGAHRRKPRQVLAGAGTGGASAGVGVGVGGGGAANGTTTTAAGGTPAGGGSLPLL